MPEGEEYKELIRKIEEIENKLKELRVKTDERERLTSRFWKERAIYIAIIVGSISILLTIIMMLIL